MHHAVEMAVLSSIQHPNVVQAYACMPEMARIEGGAHGLCMAPRAPTWRCMGLHAPAWDRMGVHEPAWGRVRLHGTA